MCIRIRMSACMNIDMMYACMHACMRVYMYLSIYVYTYLHVRMCACILTSMLAQAVKVGMYV